MSELFLRPTVIGGDKIKNDFSVIADGRRVGRIREAAERVGHNPGWDWGVNIPLPIPTWAHGSAADLDEAKTRFQAACDRFFAMLKPADIEHWHHIADAAEARSSKPKT
jgi:hypothetical protein